MSNPVLVSCAKQTWTKVVNNKQVGNIYIQKSSGFFLKQAHVFFAYVDAGDAAPAVDPGASGSTAIEMTDDYLPFNNTVAIDIYVWPANRDISVLVGAE